MKIMVAMFFHAFSCCVPFSYSSSYMDNVMQDFERSSNEIKLIPQHNYKLDAVSMNSRQKGEVSKLFHNNYNCRIHARIEDTHYGHWIIILDVSITGGIMR